MHKKLLFSVTAEDCKFDFFRGTGKGGQKRNKTSSGVRCTHIASKAVGVSDNTRSQHKNKIIAFNRMHNTNIFKNWHKLEICRTTGKLDQINKNVNNAMKLSNIKIETFDGTKWVKI